MLQTASISRRLAAALSQTPTLLNSARVHSLNTDAVDVSRNPNQCDASIRTFSSSSLYSCVKTLASNKLPSISRGPMRSMMSKAMFSSEASAIEGAATDDVKEVYDRVRKSVVEQRTAPPNSWIWSLINKCENHDDIKLLFDTLQLVRRFRLSNLRIHDNFNCNLCFEVTKACVRVGAIDFGKKVLCKHNVYGLTPSVASANALLLHAKQKNDADLMVAIVKLLKTNDLPLQPGTADLVFSICYNMDKWDLICKYAKSFVKSGVTLRRTSFDTWMTCAAKQGDVDGLWKTEKLRSESRVYNNGKKVFYHLPSAQGFLLERNPDNAAAVIQVLNQSLRDAQRPNMMVELQKLVSEWPLEVIKCRKEDERKALAAALQEDIPAVNGLSSLGLKVNADMEDLTKVGLQS